MGNKPGKEHRAGKGRRHKLKIPHARQQEAQANFGLSTHTVEKPLGTGGSGETFLCVRTATREQEAVKVLKRPLPRALKDMLANEIRIQAELGEGHFNIVNAHEVVLTDTHLCLVMEYVAGGTMTDYVSSQAHSAAARGGLLLSEDEARYFWKQCIAAVSYCHAHKVAHRDLKLDNLLLDTHNPPFIKLCDFGFANRLGNGNLHTLLGTPVYTSPQIIEHKPQGYDGRAADVWALGVLLFAMLLGAFPFDNDIILTGDDKTAFSEVLLEQVKQRWCENPANRDAAERLSPECRDLLDRVFEIDEGKRITMAAIQSHPWVNKPLPEPYAGALASLEQRQRQIDAQHVSGTARSDRAAAIKHLVETASQPPTPGAAPMTVDIVLSANGDSQRRQPLLEDVQYKA